MRLDELLPFGMAPRQVASLLPRLALNVVEPDLHERGVLVDACDGDAREFEHPSVDVRVPVPYLVDIAPEISAVSADAETAALFRDSSSVGFGSAKVDNQFSIWSRGNRVTPAMLPVALSAIVFDAVIDNPNRREFNPNCLVSGDRIRLIDHELALQPRANLIGWRPPWNAGSLAWLDRNDRHIFCVVLKKRNVDFSPLPEAWSRVSDARLREYRAAIPPEWDEALPAVDGVCPRN